MRCVIFIIMFLFGGLKVQAQIDNVLKTILLNVDDTVNSKIYTIGDSVSYVYTNPKWFGFVKNAGLNLYYTPQELWKKKNLKVLSLVVVSSAILMYYDQDMVDAVQQFGRYVGVATTNNTYNLSPVKNMPLNVPTDLSSGLYYIGDGLTELAVMGGFHLYGTITGDERAASVSSQLKEGLATVGVIVQLLKRTTGHETPERASVARGRWRFFPSFSTYASSVPKYDAFPSGHLATAMMTTTILAKNYPEYTFIKPLCYTLMTLCGLQMMNNGVHWAGDYPLAFAIGYTIGAIAVNHNRLKGVPNSDTAYRLQRKPAAPQFSINPVYMGSGASGLLLSLKF